MSISFTNQQQKAIDALGNNVLVSASAGAGKTAVLIGRLMKRITVDRVSLNEIVAMTFTEAAAAEMKIRLLKALTDALEHNPQDLFLQEQCNLVETSNISTIHAFCLQIIKNHGYIIGIDPKITENTMDNAQIKDFKEKAFVKVYQEWLENQEDITFKMLNTFSSNPLNTQDFKDAIFKIVSWMRTKQDIDQALEINYSIYEASHFDQLPEDFQKLFFYTFETRIERIIMSITSMRNDMGQPFEDPKEIKKAELILEQTSQAIEDLTQTLTQIQNQDINFYDTLPQVLNLKFAPFTNLPSYTKIRNIGLLEQIDNIMKYYQPLETVFNLSPHELIDLKTINQFAKEVLLAYQEIKMEAVSLDFDDYELFALEILNKDNQVVSKIFQETLKEIMVDEFQDTNDFQDAIIRAISNGKNIFRVGDVKQSIYRFRGAKPTIMQALQDSDEIENLSISSNFRSKEKIVNFNNKVFKSIMDLTYQSHYKESDLVEAGTEGQKLNAYPVELHLVDPSDISKKNDLKAQHLANEIIKLHQDQGIAFKDFVVLIRNHSSKQYLKKAFELAQIPHYIPASEGFYQSEIIQASLSFFRYYLYQDPYELSTILQSDFLLKTPDQLAKMKIGYETFYQGFQEEDPDTYEKISDLMKLWRHLNLKEIIQSLLHFNQAYQNTMDMQSQTNLDYLLEKAEGFGKNDLSSFMDYLSLVEDDTSVSEASFLSEEDDVVTTMTIHQSKGLEFPVVFLWGEGGHRVKDHSSMILIDDEFGVHLNHMDPQYYGYWKNMFRLIIEEKQNHEELEESLRILYVALTRPRDRLICVDLFKGDIPLLNRVQLHQHASKTELIASSLNDVSLVKHLFSMGSELEIKILPEIEDKKIFSKTPSPITKLSLLKETPTLADKLNPSSSFAMDYGTQIHQAIENLPTREWTSDDLHTVPEKYHQQLLTFNKNKKTQDLYQFPNSYHELPFMDTDSQGIMDWVLVSDSKVVMVDFKTDTVSSDLLTQRYNKQITAYKQALSLFYPEHQITQYIYSFHLDSYIEIGR